MRIEEHTNPGSGNVFNQKTLTNYNSSSQLQSLTYQGATEASNSTTFITGTQSTGPKCLVGSVSALAVVIAIASLGGSAVVAGGVGTTHFSTPNSIVTVLVLSYTQSLALCCSEAR